MRTRCYRCGATFRGPADRRNWQPKTLIERPNGVFINDNTLYRLLQESGIDFISVGHRKTLTQYHDRVLQLERTGTWELKAAGDLEEGAGLPRAS